MPGLIEDWLARQAGSAAASLAVLAPGRSPLSYGALFSQVQLAVSVLRDFGIERGRVVGIALPGGPEMGTAFLTALAAGIALPINPNAPAPEALRFLRDAHASAVIVPAGMDTAARQASVQLGLPTLELSTSQDAPAGAFNLSCQGTLPDGPEFHLNENLALLMFTGGTTGRSKIVQLTVANIQASSAYFINFAHLSPEDRVLNIMPMFHVQGLMVAFLSVILSGGSIVCTPGFDPASFFDLFAEYRPSWFSASPTILQAIANRATAHAAQIAGSRLRFIRCSAAPLPQPVAERLERSFKAPVTEALGMTEAGGSITQNPLPPGRRKPGSVGPSIGPELAVMAEGSSQILPQRVVGEVVVRGPSITSGYLEAPEDNARLVCEGWLRTGDQGALDSDGYLTITGRLKEIILRAGESISPYEVEEQLYQHPAVIQAVVFGVPDAVLGEALAAAVVTGDPSLSETELQEFIAGRLAHSKIPERILVVDSIPKTAVGKIQRVGLAEKFGLAGHLISTDSYHAPRNKTEEILAELWKKVLGLPEVSIDQRFIDLGGDSFMAIRLMAEIQQATGQDLPITALIQHPTISDLAALLIGRQDDKGQGGLVALKAGKPGQPPLIWIGYLYAHTRLSDYLNVPNPIYGLQFNLAGNLIDVSMDFSDMAQEHIRAIRQAFPHGPYLLGGWSLGGFLAYEIACQLQSAGETIPFLGIVDAAATNLPAYFRSLPFASAASMRLHQGRAAAVFHLSQLRKLAWSQRWDYLSQRISRRRAAGASSLEPGLQAQSLAAETTRNRAVLVEAARTEYDLKVKTSHSYRTFTLKRFSGSLSLFRIAEPHPAQPDPVAYGWDHLIDGSVSVEVVPGDHDTMIEEPYVQELAEKISRSIRKVEYHK